ncbi:MAG: hypothetical protein NTX50_32385 [Candidatus Sumerlaeota bacterium]|nr:hypothetical protein [Candidatus Sumerlaeota bacterium]
MSRFHGKSALFLKHCPPVSDLCVTIRRAGDGDGWISAGPAGRGNRGGKAGGGPGPGLEQTLDDREGRFHQCLAQSGRVADREAGGKGKGGDGVGVAAQGIFEVEAGGGHPELEPGDIVLQSLEFLALSPGGL